MSKVSIVLPTLDEAENIIPLIMAITQAVPHFHEIIVVDDNSPDGTARLVEEYAKKNDLRVKVEKANRIGLTKSIWRGIEKSTGDVVVWMDCDFSMPPELIPQLLKVIDERYDIAVGSRFVPGGSFKKDTKGTQDTWLAVALSRMMNYSIRFFLERGFHDYTSGYVAVRKIVFDSIKLKGDYGEYFIDFIFRAIKRGYTYKEIPYICVPRKSGYSKTGTNILQFLKRGQKYVTTTIELRWLALFGRL